MVNPDVFNDVSIFELLDDEERKVLAQQVSINNFKKGQTIFKEGDPGGLAYIIQKGTVHVTIRDANNESIVLDVAEEGDIFGMSSLLAEETHLTSAVALENTTAIEIDRNDIIALISARPMAGLDMLTIVEKHLRVAHEMMRQRVTRNINEEMDEKETFGGRVADAVARFGGSWAFVIAFSIFLIFYISVNSQLSKPWDPYPFILLNLFLSMIAAMQAPVIMMSQNRQDTKDRLRSELDYRVNLKAEVEVEEILQRVGKIEEMLIEVLPDEDKRNG